MGVFQEFICFKAGVIATWSLVCFSGKIPLKKKSRLCLIKSGREVDNSQRKKTHRKLLQFQITFFKTAK